MAPSEQVPIPSLPRLRRGSLPLTWPRVAMPSKLMLSPPLRQHIIPSHSSWGRRVFYNKVPSSNCFIDIYRCNNSLWHGDVSLGHQALQFRDAAHNIAFYLAGLAQFDAIFLVYQPYKFRTIHLSIIKLEFVIIWLAKIFMVLEWTGDGLLWSFGTPVIILGCSYEPGTWRESDRLWCLQNHQSFRSIHYDTAMCPPGHCADLDIWRLGWFAFYEDNVTFLDVWQISAATRTATYQQHCHYNAKPFHITQSLDYMADQKGHYDE